MIDDILDSFLFGDQKKRLWLLKSWVMGGGHYFFEESNICFQFVCLKYISVLTSLGSIYVLSC